MNAFTEQVRAVFADAHAVAGQFIGTEHLLVALARSPGVAGTVLESLGISAGRLVSMIDAGPGHEVGTVPFSPGAKRAIELSLREALSRSDDDIGTGHLLLALLNEEGKNAATQTLATMGLTRDRVREVVEEALRAGAQDS